MKVVSFDNRETTPKVPRFIVMIVAAFHTRKKFLEVNIFIEDNVPPNRARNGIRHGVPLHKVDDSIGSFVGGVGLLQFPGLLKMTVSLRCSEIPLQMWGLGKDSSRYT
jgi:hypothetical protein